MTSPAWCASRPESTRCPPIRVFPTRVGASSFNGLHRMLATVTSACIAGASPPPWSSRVTPLRAAFPALAARASGSRSTPTARLAPSFTAASARMPVPQPQSSTVSPPPALASSQRRHSSVVAWPPVPKAAPGSITRLTACGSGGSCQGATTHSRGDTGMGANDTWVTRTQSCSGRGSTRKGGTARPTSAQAAAAMAPGSASSGSSALTTLALHTSARGWPGSSKIGCSPAVPAWASSMDADRAPCSMRASLSAATWASSTGIFSTSQAMPSPRPARRRRRAVYPPAADRGNRPRPTKEAPPLTPQSGPELCHPVPWFAISAPHFSTR